MLACGIMPSSKDYIDTLTTFRVGATSVDQFGPSSAQNKTAISENYNIINIFANICDNFKPEAPINPILVKEHILSVLRSRVLNI